MSWAELALDYIMETGLKVCTNNRTGAISDDLYDQSLAFCHLVRAYNRCRVDLHKLKPVTDSPKQSSNLRAFGFSIANGPPLQAYLIRPSEVGRILAFARLHNLDRVHPGTTKWPIELPNTVPGWNPDPLDLSKTMDRVLSEEDRTSLTNLKHLWIRIKQEHPYQARRWTSTLTPTQPSEPNPALDGLCKARASAAYANEKALYQNQHYVVFKPDSDTTPYCLLCPAKFKCKATDDLTNTLCKPSGCPGWKAFKETYY